VRLEREGCGSPCSASITAGGEGGLAVDGPGVVSQHVCSDCIDSFATRGPFQIVGRRRVVVVRLCGALCGLVVRPARSLVVLFPSFEFFLSIGFLRDFPVAVDGELILLDIFGWFL